MRADSDLVMTGYQPGSPRQRLISTLLSAGIVLLALLIALYQTQFAPRLEKTSNPVTFDVTGEDKQAGAKAEKQHKQEKKHETKEPQQARVRTPRPREEKPVQEKPVQEKPAFTFLKISHADMAAADISGMKHSGSASAASGGSAAYGPGEGPGGAILYNADWFKAPTDAQLGGYLPANAPQEGWGMIACQTLDHYRVDNCQILGESPRGSGFGRAVLEAAWQFQVVPPRINGKAQLGTWVRIRIDYGVRKAVG
ncbi:energy transducer TonB [Novosphingobium sp.]|uniref:energy transducer TonB family protein n=1 Tax=Novosphingobium sp. TaxID=1874826 RepID=UPI002B4926DE|nr:energy transducer TonB [Novosphingobium sp.]HKR90918.1 energy transducer TonB [Novosphingobium sp.]